MDQAIRKGFQDEAEYRRVSDYLFRYTRSKLMSEKIWDLETCTYKARDMVTDSIVKYLKRVSDGHTVDHKIAYMRTSIYYVLISKEFIKEKTAEKEMVIVYNSPDKMIEEVSFTKWEREKEKDAESSEEPCQYTSDIKKILNGKLSEVELRIVELKDEGLINRKVADILNLSEGYISKLVKKLRMKVTRSIWN